MEANKHLLIVDDDSGIRKLLSEFLQQHGFLVTALEHGQRLLETLKEKTIDLIILDIMLPGSDGFELCRKVRSQYTTPIIMLTAVAEETDRIVGLEMGSDDYLVKPFNPRELLARIKAIFRRINRDEEDSIRSEFKTYKFADWSLDEATRTLISPDGLDTSLSGAEYDLLLVFLKNPQLVLSRDRLLELSRNREAGPFDRSVDIQVSRLRHKLETDPKKPEIIKTVRSGGYIFSTKVATKQS